MPDTREWHEMTYGEWNSLPRRTAEEFFENCYDGCPYCGSERSIKFENSEVHSHLRHDMIYHCGYCDETWRELFIRKGVKLDKFDDGENDGVFWEDDFKEE